MWTPMARPASSRSSIAPTAARANLASHARRRSRRSCWPDGGRIIARSARNDFLVPSTAREPYSHLNLAVYALIEDDLKRISCYRDLSPSLRLLVEISEKPTGYDHYCCVSNFAEFRSSLRMPRIHRS